MKKSSPTLLARNMAAKHSVRISMPLSLSNPRTRQSSLRPLLRVGHMLIATEQENLSKSPEIVHLMLRRTLMAILSYLELYPKLCSDSDIATLKVSVSRVIRSVSSSCSREPIEMICRSIENVLLTESVPTLLFQFPHMLLTDISLSSKDFLGCLWIRYQSFLSTLISSAFIESNSITPRMISTVSK